MPNLGTTSPSPASTPQLMLENNYRQLQDWGQRQEQELQSLGLDDEMYAEKLGKLQTDFDKQRADIETNMNTVRQTQNWMDLGIIDNATGEKLKWGAVVPQEALDMMFPEPETVPEADTSRRPLTPAQLEDLSPEMKGFMKAAGKETRRGMFGWDWAAKDKRTHASLFQQYRTWQMAIGYHGKQFTNTEREQVDRKWDAWARQEYPESGWDPTSKGVRALRAKGPITRGFTERFRQTPTGPREAGNPLTDNIIANLPKKREAQPEPQPETGPARINIRNKKTGKRMFSDDGGRTWQNAK